MSSPPALQRTETKSAISKKMKTIIKAVLTVAIACAMFASVVTAKADPTPVPLVKGVFTNSTFASSNSLNRATSTPFIVRGGTTTNINSQWVRLYRGRGIAIYPLFAGTNAASTGLQTIIADISPDGTNAITTTNLSMTLNGQGLSGVSGYTNWMPDVCDNAHSIRLRSWQNGDQSTNAFFVTNIQYVIIP